MWCSLGAVLTALERFIGGGGRSRGTAAVSGYEGTVGLAGTKGKLLYLLIELKGWGILCVSHTMHESKGDMYEECVWRTDALGEDKVGSRVVFFTCPGVSRAASRAERRWRPFP